MAKRNKSPRSKSKPRPTGRSARNTPSKPAKVGPPAAGRSKHDIELIARGLWTHGSRVLLCRNVDKGYLYLPGGHVEFGESASEACAREFLEETGQRVACSDVLLVTEGHFTTRKRPHHEINLVFRAEPLSGSTRSAASHQPPTIKSREPGIAFEWIDLAAIVDLDVRPLAIKAWLASGAGGSSQSQPSGRAEWVSEIAS